MVLAKPLSVLKIWSNPGALKTWLPGLPGSKQLVLLSHRFLRSQLRGLFHGLSMLIQPEE